MKYWVFTGSAAIGPFGPEEIRQKAPGFGPETVVAPDGAASVDAWKPARSFPELQALFFQAPAPPPAPPAEPPPKLQGLYCPACSQPIASDSFCCAGCGEVLPKELRDDYLARTAKAAPSAEGFWRKYLLYVGLGLAGLAAAGSALRMVSRNAARRAARERLERAESLPPIDLKVPGTAAPEPPAAETPAEPAPSKGRREHRATLAQRRAKRP